MYLLSLFLRRKHNIQKHFLVCADRSSTYYVHTHWKWKTLNVQGRINGEGGIFVKNNKRAGPNKTVQRGFFFSKLINVHARLFGTLDYIFSLYVMLENSSSTVQRYRKKVKKNHRKYRNDIAQKVACEFVETMWLIASIFFIYMSDLGVGR